MIKELKSGTLFVGRNGRDIRVVSEPGYMRFQVWLPLVANGLKEGSG